MQILTDAYVVFESGRGEEATEIRFLEQVPLGEVDTPMQSFVLRNEGGTNIDHILDLTDVELVNESAPDFPLFKCPVTRGIVPAYGKQTIYWRFRPLMQRALLDGEGFIAKEGAEPLVDEKKTTIPAPLFPLPGQLCLLSTERIGFGSVACGSIERRLVCLVCPRTKPHLALRNRANERREKRGILHDWKESHPLIMSQNSSSSSSINAVGASSEVNQIFSYYRFPSARSSSSMNASSSSSSSVVASNISSGNIYDHSIIASLSTQHSQLGKIKGLPSSSYPVTSQSSSSSSLAIAPHQPSFRKQPPRVCVIERMTKKRGIQIATRFEQFHHFLEKARDEEKSFLLVLARRSVDLLSATAALTLQLRKTVSSILLNEVTKQAQKIAAQAKEEQKIRILQKEKKREAFGMYNLTPTTSAMK
ncbi:uncharacterized protein MONOS_2318 [Monocercomonoides exilis]|uniref:uncharacterized protein n=1 Tax=Monocercomonoides exilis TaxID=2049356 RepID=UPI00355A2E83|nr:hypothetical protein MONOS_2318 [Monocercomonoides exilis]|eukprot:MONOS_2318.1-p1 / transcript=MONOS_2318.1 / gene=MONOS_2318 / organism=Monocercomonoides_exilis_PA203 / gene_product=unspecified product / transcript_product=unspecified product / location=Mono_scaffold00047:99314-100882(-) / protein_length=420 / sequence_SO=supercontig / SO=protein_coding / is_pseudo=false